MQKLLSILIAFALITTMAAPVFSHEFTVSESAEVKMKSETKETAAPVETDVKELPHADETPVDAEIIGVTTDSPLTGTQESPRAFTRHRAGPSVSAAPTPCAYVQDCAGTAGTGTPSHRPVDEQPMLVRCGTNGEFAFSVRASGTMVIEVDSVVRQLCGGTSTISPNTTPGGDNPSGHRSNVNDTPVENTLDELVVDEPVVPTGETELTNTPSPTAFLESPPLDAMIIGKADGRMTYREPAAPAQPATNQNPIAGLVGGANAPILGVLALLIIGAFFVFRKK